MKKFWKLEIRKKCRSQVFVVFRISKSSNWKFHCSVAYMSNLCKSLNSQSVMMKMITFITINSGVVTVPLIEGLCAQIYYFRFRGMPLCARRRGETGVTVDRDKIEFMLFNFSSIFNITLREEVLSSRKQNPIMPLCPVFMALVTWVEHLGEKLKDTIPLPYGDAWQVGAKAPSPARPGM